MAKTRLTKAEALERMLASPVNDPWVIFDLLEVGRNAGYEAIHKGEIIAVKYGKKYKIPSRPNLERLGIAVPAKAQDGG